MSLINKCVVITVGASAGLFLAALASSATAAADSTTPIPPSVPDLVQQIVTSPGSIPQQLLQTTLTTLTGVSAPAPAAVAPTTGVGSSVPGLPNVTQLLPPMPNLNTAPTVSPAATVPGLVPGLAPGLAPGVPLAPAPSAVQRQPSTGTWLPLPTLP